MQKAFKDIIERLEEQRGHICNCMPCNGCKYIGDCNEGEFAEDVALDRAIEIVNQVAEEYSHRNVNLVIDSSHRVIGGLNDVIERLQYKADNIKAKLEPSYFTECIDYLKSLPKCDDGWIPCEDKYPDTDKYILLSFSNFSIPIIGRYEEDENGGAFYAGDEDETLVSQDMFVNAWTPLPKPYREDE